MVVARIIVCGIAAVVMTEAANIHKQTIYCEADHECGQGRYCYHTGYCVDCTECVVHHRLQPKVPSCPKKPVECGGCLPGFMEEILVESSQRDTCIPEPEAESSNSWIIVGLASFTVVLLLIIAFLLFYLKKGKNKGRVHDVPSGSNSNNVESSLNTQSSTNVMFVNGNDAAVIMATPEHPPSYETLVSAPLLPADHLNFGGEFVTTYKDGKESSCLQGYVRSQHLFDNESDDNDSLPVNVHISPPYPHEEETLESFWTPNENCSEAEENICMSNNVHDQDNDSQSKSEESSTFEPLSSPLNDSGVLDSTSHASTSSLSRPFDHLNSSSCATSLEKPTSYGLTHSGSNDNNVSQPRPFAHLNSSGFVTALDRPSTHGLTRSCSDDDIVGAPVKRQRHDSGTQSLGDAISNEESDSTIPDQYKST